MDVSLARAVLAGADEAAVVRGIERLKSRHPGLSRDELALRLIRRTARRCAVVGALTGAPAAWLGAAAVRADLPFQTLELARLALALAAVYRRDMDVPERGLCAAASLAVAAAAGSVRAGAVRLAHAGLARRRSDAAAALLGGLAGGSLAYAAAAAFGRAAREHFHGGRLGLLR